MLAFLHSLKTCKKRDFLDVFKEYKKGTLGRNRLIKWYWNCLKNYFYLVNIISLGAKKSNKLSGYAIVYAGNAVPTVGIEHFELLSYHVKIIIHDRDFFNCQEIIRGLDDDDWINTRAGKKAWSSRPSAIIMMSSELSHIMRQLVLVKIFYRNVLQRVDLFVSFLRICQANQDPSLRCSVLLGVFVPPISIIVFIKPIFKRLPQKAGVVLNGFCLQ